MILLLNILVLFLSLNVVANTEIVNFVPSEAQVASVPFVEQWPVFNHTHNERQWSITPAPVGTPLRQVCENDSPKKIPCPHEWWIVLDLTQGDWDSYSKFTLRLSWPASFPSEFSIQIYDPKSLATHFSSAQSSDTSIAMTRTKYARVRVVDIGIRTPTAEYKALLLQGSIKPTPVPFILILEPLYFGILPATLLPTVGLLILVAIVAGLALPMVNRHLQVIAAQVREEIRDAGRTSKTD